MPYAPLLILEIFGIQLLLAFTLTAFGVMMAARIRQMQAFMALTQMLVLPLYFLSGSLFPASNLPTWLTVLNRINPLTYAVDPMRRLVFDHLIAQPSRAPAPRSGRHLGRVAGADAARGRDRGGARARDARGRDRRVQQDRVAAAELLSRPGR